VGPQGEVGLPGENASRMIGEIIIWTGQIHYGGTSGWWPIINGVHDPRWQVCNGSWGTPDLRHRFLIGTDNQDFYTNQTGGITDMSYMLQSWHMPLHTHNIDLETKHSGSHSHTYLQAQSSPNTVTRSAETYVTDKHMAVAITESERLVKMWFTDKYLLIGYEGKQTWSEGSHKHSLVGSTKAQYRQEHQVPLNFTPPYYSVVFLMYIGDRS
jgi:hypothetical protein